jgi:Ulp1 family protease
MDEEVKDVPASLADAQEEKPNFIEISSDEDESPQAPKKKSEVCCFFYYYYPLTVEESNNPLIGQKFNVPIRKFDLHCLQHEEMINDAVVNFIVQIFQRDCNAIGASVYILNSYFYTTLCGVSHDKFNFEKVSAWIKV